MKLYYCPVEVNYISRAQRAKAETTGKGGKEHKEKDKKPVSEKDKAAAAQRLSQEFQWTTAERKEVHSRYLSTNLLSNTSRTRVVKIASVELLKAFVLY